MCVFRINKNDNRSLPQKRFQEAVDARDPARLESAFATAEFEKVVAAEVIEEAKTLVVGLAAGELLATAEAARTGNNSTIEREPFQATKVGQPPKMDLMQSISFMQAYKDKR